MKILWITGDDYSAASFKANFSASEIADQLKVGDPAKLFEHEVGIDGDGYYFEAELFEFGDVDPAFIKFIQGNVRDYDQQKHENFFVLESTES